LEPIFDLEFGVEFEGTEYGITRCHGVKTGPNNRPERPGVQEYNVYLLIYLITYLLIYLLTHLLSHSLTHSLTHSMGQISS